MNVAKRCPKLKHLVLMDDIAVGEVNVPAELSVCTMRHLTELVYLHIPSTIKNIHARTKKYIQSNSALAMSLLTRICGYELSA